MVTEDEFSKNTKDSQENTKPVHKVAKTSILDIQASDDFIPKKIGEQLVETVGIPIDKMVYTLQERRERLTEKTNQFIRERNIKTELKPVSLKFALPVIENGLLEDDDELQDLWARLIASSVDPNYDGTMRTAFIDILKQLEVNDVHVLNYIYEYYEKKNRENIAMYEYYEKKNRDNIAMGKSDNVPIKKIINISGNAAPVWKEKITKKLGIRSENYKESIDNLIRVGCIAYYISDKEVNVPLNDKRVTISPVAGTRNRTEKVTFNVTHTYDRVCITQLGISFAKACMPPQSDETKKA